MVPSIDSPKPVASVEREDSGSTYGDRDGDHQGHTRGDDNVVVSMPLAWMLWVKKVSDRDVDATIKGDSGRDKDGIKRSICGEFMRSKRSSASHTVSKSASSEDACEPSSFSSSFGPS